MDKVILSFFLIIGIAFFIFSLREQPIKDWLLSFLLTAYLANILGTLVVKFKWIKYLKLGYQINSGQLFELLIFPLIVVCFYKTSYQSRLANIILQCVLYTLGLTIVEVILERNTNVIEYVKWNWIYTLLSVFCFMLAIRFLLNLINGNRPFVEQ